MFSHIFGCNSSVTSLYDKSFVVSILSRDQKGNLVFSDTFDQKQSFKINTLEKTPQLHNLLLARWKFFKIIKCSKTSIVSSFVSWKVFRDFLHFLMQGPILNISELMICIKESMSSLNWCIMSVMLSSSMLISLVKTAWNLNYFSTYLYVSPLFFS